MKVESSHIHLDIVGGIAGDMFISAMLDTFKPLQSEVMEAIELVLPDNIGSPTLVAGLNSGISGLMFSLALNKTAKTEPEQGHSHTQKLDHNHSHEHSLEHSFEHSHEHSHSHHHHSHGTDETSERTNNQVQSPEGSPSHEHTHNHEHAHEHEHEHSHETTYRYLCELITNSSLSDEVSEIAVDILTIIGKAEAKIHNKTLDDVHFHELADWDSLMDVVAAAVILKALSAYSWSTSTLPLGSGLVNTQHGLIPVPAPATAEILLGFEFIDDNIKGERITPTGAAILRYLRNKNVLTSQPQGKLIATGYGLGTKVFPGMPNILRALHFDKSSSNNGSTDSAKGMQQGTVVIIEFDIDDMTGEELALSLDIIRAQRGVIDVSAHSIRGKKNRSVESIKVLTACDYFQEVIEHCFNQTTTIGLRYRFETRQHLPREHYEIQGVACKSVLRPNGDTTHKIEHDEVTELETLNMRRTVKSQVEVLSKERR